MDERPRPDIDQTREALRQHDERAEEPVSDDAAEDSASDEGEESPSDESGEE